MPPSHYRHTLTLSQHALHEVDAVAHHHSIPLRSILAVHRLDLHTLYDWVVFRPAFCDPAQAALRECAECVGHPEYLDVLAVGGEGVGVGGGGRLGIRVVWWRW